jgi:hypothetical protein
MVSRKLRVLAVAGALGLWAAPAVAQGRGAGAGCGPGGWGRQGAYWRLFDPSKIETLSGEVVSVQRVRPVKGVSEGVHLELKTEREKVSVHLGPAWYIDNQDPSIEAKDRVEIVGSRVQVNDKPAIIASEIRKGDEWLKLRDAEGYPLWCGWRRR